MTGTPRTLRQAIEKGFTSTHLVPNDILRETLITQVDHHVREYLEHRMETMTLIGKQPVIDATLRLWETIIHEIVKESVR